MANGIKETKKSNPTQNKVIRAWLSEDDHKILLEKCKEGGMSISAFIRKIINEGEIRKYDTVSLNEIAQELNNIGNDINSIAKKVKERDNVIEEDNEKLKLQYERLIDMFLDKVMGVN